MQRTLADFDGYWASSSIASSIDPKIAAMTSGDVELLKTALRARLTAVASGRITCSVRA
ncbi:MAG TPA: hypothetical protein PLW68_05305 [Casimicrobiaceae bacterium]|nr:hypothetical protein [Casimicrobiaceae bacterium]